MLFAQPLRSSPFSCCQSHCKACQPARGRFPPNSLQCMVVVGGLSGVSVNYDNSDQSPATLQTRVVTHVCIFVEAGEQRNRTPHGELFSKFHRTRGRNKSHFEGCSGAFKNTTNMEVNTPLKRAKRQDHSAQIVNLGIQLPNISH